MVSPSEPIRHVGGPYGPLVGKGGSEDGGIGYRVRLRMGRFEKVVDAYPLSGNGLIFATPQWVETPVRLRVTVEKLVQTGNGNDNGASCEPSQRNNVDVCTWKQIGREGATSSSSSSSSSSDSAGALPDIWLNIQGSCGDVNAPDVNLTISIFDNLISSQTDLENAAGDLNSKYILLFDIDPGNDFTSILRTTLVNLTKARIGYMQSLASQRPVLSTLESPSGIIKTTNGIDVTTIDGVLSFGLSESSGLTLLFAFISELSSADAAVVLPGDTKGTTTTGDDTTVGTTTTGDTMGTVTSFAMSASNVATGATPASVTYVFTTLALVATEKFIITHVTEARYATDAAVACAVTGSSGTTGTVTCANVGSVLTCTLDTSAVIANTKTTVVCSSNIKVNGEAQATTSTLVTDKDTEASAAATTTITTAATCAQITTASTGGAFVCGTGFANKASPADIACTVTPCLTNSDATQKAACCQADTQAMLTSVTPSTLVATATPTTVTYVFTPTVALAAGNEFAITHSAARYIDGTVTCSYSGSASTIGTAVCTAGTSGTVNTCVLASDAAIEASATTVVCNSHIATNGAADAVTATMVTSTDLAASAAVTTTITDTGRATCAQITTVSSGGDFDCGTGFTIRVDKASINCGATPCLTNTDPIQKVACCDADAAPKKEATCAQITDGEGGHGGDFDCGTGFTIRVDKANINCGTTPCLTNTDDPEWLNQRETCCDVAASDSGGRRQRRTAAHLLSNTPEPTGKRTIFLANGTSTINNTIGSTGATGTTEAADRPTTWGRLLVSRSVSLFQAGGLGIGEARTKKNSRCRHCDRVLASGWNHVLLLSRVHPIGTGDNTKFSRKWFQADRIDGWGDDSWKQTTVPLFANTNVDVEGRGPSECGLPIHTNGFYPLYSDMSCANKFSTLAGGDGTSHSHVFGGVRYFMPNGVTLYHGTYQPPPQVPNGCAPPMTVEGYYPLYTTSQCANSASPKGTSHEHLLDATGGSRRRRTRRTLLASHAQADSTAAITKTYYMPDDVPLFHGDFVPPVTRIQSHDGSIFNIDAARSHTCSVRSPRRVGCWGVDSDAPMKDKLGFSPTLNVLMSATGAYHTCVLTSEGDVQCGGANYGNSRKPPYSKCYKADFVYRQGNPICNSTKHIYTDVSASIEHTCAIDGDTGTVRCWGSDEDTGRLGPSPRDNLGRPIPSPGTSPPFGETHGPFLQVTTGSVHTCALRIDGVVLCWGQGPVACPPPTELKFTRIASGLWHACGVVNGTGDVYCWGRDYANQVSGAPTLNSGASFKEISAGEEHTCASVSGSPGELQQLDAVKVLGCNNDCTTSCTEEMLRTTTTTKTGRRRAAAHGTTASTTTVPPRSSDNAACDHAIVQSGTVLCWGNVRSYMSVASMPEEKGKQYMSEGILMDVAEATKVWILTKDGPWFYHPKQGMSQIPSNPLLLYSPCTVTLTPEEEFLEIIQKATAAGIHINNTGPECECVGSSEAYDIDNKECGKKYKQCIYPGAEICALYNNNPPQWTDSKAAVWYSVVVGFTLLCLFVGVHVLEVRAAY